MNKIISGGQTGADRAGLDFAIEHKIPHGGFCPKGRIAEDGKLPDKYKLEETSGSNYLERTLKNVLLSDCTIIFTTTPNLSGGSLRTKLFCLKNKKPVFHYHNEKNLPQLRIILGAFDTINIAGSRASKDNNIYDFTKRSLEKATMC